MTSTLLVDVDHQGAIGVDRAVTQESVEPDSTMRRSSKVEIMAFVTLV